MATFVKNKHGIVHSVPEHLVDFVLARGGVVVPDPSKPKTDTASKAPTKRGNRGQSKPAKK